MDCITILGRPRNAVIDWEIFTLYKHSWNKLFGIAEMFYSVKPTQKSRNVLLRIAYSK